MMDAPARYSVDQIEFDPALGARLLITLDGVEQQDVVSYDAEASTVTRARHDADGKIVVEGDEIALETVSGQLVVTLKPHKA